MIEDVHGVCDVVAVDVHLVVGEGVLAGAVGDVTAVECGSAVGSVL